MYDMPPFYRRKVQYTPAIALIETLFALKNNKIYRILSKVHAEVSESLL